MPRSYGPVSGITAFYAIVHFSVDELDHVFKEMHAVLDQGGLFLFSFHIGEQNAHLEEFLGVAVKMDFTFFTPEAVVEKLKATSFKIDDVLIRYPYDDVEFPSKRCYVFASKN